MKKTLAAAILLCLLAPSLAEAQVPTPPDVSTLGPIIIYSAGDSGNFVNITSIKNQTEYANPIQLEFNVQHITLMGQFYNVGYSIDGGVVNSVRDFVSKSVDNSSTDWYWKASVKASLVLPPLSEGSHRITVYSGWQYLGIRENPSLQRFEVLAYETVDFKIGNYKDISIDANTQPSKVEIFSPTNSTVYNSSNLLLSVNVGLPESYAATNTYIDKVYYKIDNQQNCTTVYDSGTANFDDRIESSRTNLRNRLFSYSTYLTAVPSGNHSITVFAASGSNYFNINAPDMFDSYLLTNNSTVYFKINNSAEDMVNVYPKSDTSTFGS